MTKRLIKHGPHWNLARAKLSEVLVGRAEVGLNDAWRDLDHAFLRIEQQPSGADLGATRFVIEVLHGVAARDAVSRLLRDLGFRKAGITGSALTYDRQPLYRKGAA